MVVYLAQFWYLALIVIAFLLLAKMLKRDRINKDKGGINRSSNATKEYKDVYESLKEYSDHRKMENWKL